jgi:hypothetical protein
MEITFTEYSTIEQPPDHTIPGLRSQPGVCILKDAKPRCKTTLPCNRTQKNKFLSRIMLKWKWVMSTCYSEI